MLADKTDNFADNTYVTGDRNRVVRRVGRHEKDTVISLVQLLNSRLVSKQCHNDVAIVCGLLFVDDDDIPGHDVFVDHGVSFNLEAKVVGSCGRRRGDKDPLLDVLLGQDGGAGRDSAQHRYHQRWSSRCTLNEVRLREVPFALECLDVYDDRVEGVKSKVAPYVLQAGTEPCLACACLDEFQNGLLLAGQLFHHPPPLYCRYYTCSVYTML